MFFSLFVITSGNKPEDFCFLKTADLREHFQVQETLLCIAATLEDIGMDTMYKALFLQNITIY